MKIDQEISIRIELLRFPLIVGVVLIHVYNEGTGVSFSENQFIYSGNDFSVFVQILFSEVLARTAVPLFFLMSSVLLFRDFKPTFECYEKKIRSRVRSILVPYLTWNLAVLIFRLTIENIPNISVFISGRNKLVSDYSFYDYVELLWNPVSYHFWFIKDLFIIAILSSVIYLLIKYLFYLPIFLFFLLWLINSPQLILGMDWQTLIFCCLGCLIAIKNWNLSYFDRYSKTILISYLILGIFSAALKTINDTPALDQFSKILTLLGIVAIWCLSKLILDTKIQIYLVNLAPFSFFVYAAHEPLMTIFKKFVYRFLPPSNSFEVISYYFLIPTITIATLIVFASLLKSRMPQFYAFLTGGRTSSK